MGSPKKQRKKFSTPSHPWQKERILAEKDLLNSYGLRRKYEIWKMNTILKNFTSQAKNLIAAHTPQSEIERNQLLAKTSSLGLIEISAKIDDVLSLALKDIMERRLQTLVYRKNLAHSLKQARQFIIHEHISIGDKTITAPSYLVPLSEESNIKFSQGSVLVDVNHPERKIEEKKTEKKVKEKPEKKQEKREISSQKTKIKKTKTKKEEPEITEKKESEEKPKEDKTEVLKVKKEQTKPETKEK